MKFANMNILEFTELLASKEAVPGGGGASALVGALGCALGSMVGNLTVGNKKYVDVKSDIESLLENSDDISKDLLTQIDKDAEVFAPLAKAYSIPKDDPTRAETMERALENACTAPLEIMENCAKAIELLEEYADKGSAIAISDVGVGVQFCKAALQGASLNIFINTKSMKDKDNAAKIEQQADKLLDEFVPRADALFENVVAKLRSY